MASPKRLKILGDQILILMDDGSKLRAYPGQSGLWFVKKVGGGTGPVDPGNGALANIYGPGRGEELDGWPSHQSYSAGGYDWSFMAYGDPIPAPAAGTLRTSGGSGENAAGNIGSAGLRSIFTLDSPVARVYPASPLVMNGGGTEAEGPMISLVIQHQSKFAPEGHYNPFDNIGFVGDSGNGVKHVHLHGLDPNGRRVDFVKFIAGFFG